MIRLHRSGLKGVPRSGLLRQRYGPGPTEPGWRSPPVLPGAEAGPQSAEDSWDLFLGQFLDQLAQFLALGAHGVSVRVQPWPRG